MLDFTLNTLVHIVCQPEEIADAQWFTGQLAPDTAETATSGWLIEEFLGQL